MIFVDTGALLAAYSENDQHHEKAVQLWGKIHNRRDKLLTSNFVLDEFFTLLARKKNYRYAADRARSIYSSRVLEIVRPLYDDEMEAVDLFEKYADQEVSFTDCVSFVLIRRYRIGKVFSFDRHFKLAGVSILS